MKKFVKNTIFAVATISAASLSAYTGDGDYEQAFIISGSALFTTFVYVVFFYPGITAGGTHE